LCLAAVSLDGGMEMLDTVRRFWQDRAPQPCAPREAPERPAARDESPVVLPRQAHTAFAFTSIDVGNYA
jgi:hypothetical protein